MIDSKDSSLFVELDERDYSDGDYESISDSERMDTMSSDSDEMNNKKQSLDCLLRKVRTKLDDIIKAEFEMLTRALYGNEVGEEPEELESPKLDELKAELEKVKEDWKMSHPKRPCQELMEVQEAYKEEITGLKELINTMQSERDTAVENLHATQVENARLRAERDMARPFYDRVIHELSQDSPTEGTLFDRIRF